MKVLTHPRLLLIYAVTALGYGGVFTAFTFPAPMMQDLAGFSPAAVSWILLGYGVSVAIGNIWGGKLADKHGAVPALKFISPRCLFCLWSSGDGLHAVCCAGYHPSDGGLCLR